MADDQVEPPPLFETVAIDRVEKEDDDDLFVSAHQDPSPQFDEICPDLTNGDSCLPNPKINDFRGELETVPINNSSLPISMEQVEAVRGDEFLEISITEPQKVGEGMGAYMAYRVKTKTNMPIFKKREFSVTRRFSDFLGLHDKLTEKYLKVGRIIPPAPEKSVIGMTKIKISSQPEGNTTNGNDFVERRRASLERYLKRTAQHPVLVLDPDFREFLESDIELPKATSTSALSSAGVMRLFNKVGETVNKITYKMDETDPWFEEKLAHVEGLETQLRKLHTSVEAMVTYRRELANLTNGVSRSAAMLSTCEDHNSLSRALSQLADTEEKHWQHSQQMLAKKREAKAKLELTNRIDKLDQANAEVVEWESKVERGQENFDKISQMIKKEMDRFEKCRIHDFKIMFIKYLENHLEHQAQLVKFWETFLPEAKAIA
ncbi:hypothetical protein NQ314_007147 [Rhamnusium bicolor]|uniref:PX domain-containing protein n=1 Tax=Rhamnusium bicolor TaxID=1586634 RepID=A0AAV8YQX2_9CUCU|nr:hypothetical protein NQ314_007147 [Rhamnusium bicolor]